MQKRSLSLALFFFGFALGLVAKVEAQVVCKTTVPAGLVVNTTWTKANSPYCVIGDIQVSLLTIEPGVEVYIDPGVNITVLSTITAVGTREEPILFTARNQDPLERWGHIAFTDTQPGSEFAHCTFEYAGDSAMVIVNSTPVIRDSVYSRNYSPGNGGALRIHLASGDLSLSRCRFEENEAALHGGGISANTGTGTLALNHTVIRANIATGAFRISRVGGGVRVIGSSEFTDCSFEDNRVEAVSNNGTFTVRTSRGGSIYTNGNCKLVRTSILNGIAKASRATQNSRAQAFGGAIYQVDGLLSIFNSLIGCNTISGDVQSSGAGVYVSAGDAHLENTTIARHNKHGLSVNTGTTDVLNSILWDNNGGAGNAQISGTANVSYSCVQGGYTGMGNIAFNPVFAGAACCESDLKIVLGSPCIDAGDPNPNFNDSCFPPSLGTERNDMGPQGGPNACPSPPQTADAYAFGESCVGQQSDPKMTPVTFPVIGQTFTVQLSGLNPNQSAAVGIIGFSRQCFGGQDLPLDLEFLSMTGCKLLVAFDRTKLINSTAGTATWNLPMPLGTEAIGLEFFLQGVSVDPGSNFIGLTMSNALDCRVGN